jgi:hypothetical protein
MMKKERVQDKDLTMSLRMITTFSFIVNLNELPDEFTLNGDTVCAEQNKSTDRVCIEGVKQTMTEIQFELSLL